MIGLEQFDNIDSIADLELREYEKTHITPDMLPPVIGDWVGDISLRINGSFDIAATTALAILGNLIGSQVGMRPKQNDTHWVEYPNLWGMVIGDPSTKKTPIFKELERSLGRIIKTAKGEYIAAKKAHNAQLDLRSAKVEDIKRSKQIKTEEEKQKAISALEDIGGVSSAPTMKRYIVNDTTIEKLGEICIENGRGVLLHSDELSGIFAGFEKKGREGDRAFYLEGYSGKASKFIDRVGRGSIHIESLTLGLFGNIQPDKIKQYVYEASNGKADGLLQRFQLVMFVEALPPKWIDQVPNKEARDRFDKLVEFFTGEEFTGMKTDKYREDIFFYTFTTQAQKRFEEWYLMNEAAAIEESNKAIAAHLHKYNKLICGLALIFHLCDQFAGYTEMAGVSLDSLNKAIRISEVLKSHAYRLYSTFEREEEIKEEVADKILHYLKDKTLPIKFQAVAQGVWHNGKRPTKKEITEAIKGLYRYEGSHIVRKT